MSCRLLNCVFTSDRDGPPFGKKGRKKERKKKERKKKERKRKERKKKERRRKRENSELRTLLHKD